MYIRGIKLVTGEEIICDLEITDDEMFKIKNPVQIRIIPPQIPGSQPSMGFVPFPAFAEQRKDSEVVVDLMHVVYTYEPAEEIAQNYNQTFGSGIITPTKKLITG
jgi:hypothetical protein